MPASPPKLSIGLPVYNGERFLAEALESILNQTYGDFRVLVCDNASTDGTEAIVREFERRDRRIELHRADQNRGAIWNFNRAFRLSQSPYFKWAAADDVLAPTYVEKCIAAIDADSTVAWCHSLSTHVDVHGIPLDEAYAHGISYKDRENLGPVGRFHSVLLAKSCLDSYGLMRASFVQKTRMLRPHFGSEKVLMAEIALYGGYREIPEELFYSRVHSAMAGGLQSVDEQQQLIDPRRRSAESFPRLRLLGGYAKAIRRAPLPLTTKLAAYACLGRYVLQVSKWKRVIVKTLSRQGTGGDICTSAEA